MSYAWVMDAERLWVQGKWRVSHCVLSCCSNPHLWHSCHEAWNPVHNMRCRTCHARAPKDVKVAYSLLSM
jgi:hypothetical protein